MLGVMNWFLPREATEGGSGGNAPAGPADRAERAESSQPRAQAVTTETVT